MLASIVDQFIGFLCFGFFLFLLMAGGATILFVKIAQKNEKVKDAAKGVVKRGIRKAGEFLAKAGEDDDLGKGGER